MLGSLDCMHWEWENFPVAWQGQYHRGDKPHLSIILEAAASQDAWIWHAFFGCAGAMNDLNMLNHSPIFEDVYNGIAPDRSFQVNGATYKHGYYLVLDAKSDCIQDHKLVHEVKTKAKSKSKFKVKMTELVDYHTLWKNYMTYSQRVFELNQENLKLSSDKSLLEMKIVDLEKLIQSEKGQESENSELSNQITDLQQSLGLLPGLLEIDSPVNDQTEFPLAGSNPGTLHKQTVREEHDQTTRNRNWFRVLTGVTLKCLITLDVRSSGLSTYAHNANSLFITNAENAELLLKVTNLENLLSNERSVITSLKIDLQNEHDELLKHSFGNAQNLKLVTSLRKENECLPKKVHELDEDKKVVENKLISSHSRVIELSNQVNDFEKIVIIERSNFEKERRAFEAKIGELSLKISVFDEQKENKIFKEFSESTCYVNCCYDDDDSNSYDGMNVFDSLESCTDSCTNKTNVVDSELVKFEKMLQDERKVFEEERKVFEKERKSFELKSDKLSKKISDLERQIVNERKDFEKKKNVFESKKKGLKKKNVRVEKDRCVEFEFEEESKGFEKERKSFEEKSVLFRKKIANLEVQLSDERSAFKRKEHLLQSEIKGFEQMITELKNKTFAKNDFEEEKRVFEMEIRKLTRSLSELFSDIMKEQIMSYNLKKKLDEIVEEKNILSAMVKDLEDIVFKVNLNEPKSPDVIVQSPYVDYADSVCSFKTAPSYLHVDVSSTKCFTPSKQIRTSNLFYDHQIDGSDYLKRKYVVLTVEQISLFEKNRRKVGMVPISLMHYSRGSFCKQMASEYNSSEPDPQSTSDVCLILFVISNPKGEIVGCKIGLYPRSQVGARSEDKGKVKVKCFSYSEDAKRIKFKGAQEAARKDIERAFGILQKRWSIVKQPARIMERRTMSNIMYACIILHNMILENKNKAICVVPHDLPDPPNPQLTEEQRMTNIFQVRNSTIHHNLRADLVEHIWNLDIDF
ncbi:hypothetical protein OSB04_015668 [Centaurea solstitialis]|uniref:Protein ALP1-like n=1 Tax=Centaurea solstitialis TaxID=347529 RepID=A0AA38SZM7_9ASTR|nr:hypothetical protein OSB04_015668 [Centaurea solstitialis]